jgi:DNA-binding NtrC family response regulator
MNVHILIVDDEPNVRLVYRSALETEGYEVDEASSGARALELFSGHQYDVTQHHKYDVAILDLRMPEMDGFELLARMNKRNITTPVAFITAHGDVPNAVQAMKLGAIDFLQKPITPEQLRTVVKEILTRHSSVARPPHTTVDCDYCLRCAKRAINLRDFDAARKYLVQALEISPDSPQALNLCGVMLELREEHERAGVGNQ